jgi:hypothetical protein
VRPTSVPRASSLQCGARSPPKALARKEGGRKEGDRKETGRRKEGDREETGREERVWRV